MGIILTPNLLKCNILEHFRYVDYWCLFIDLILVSNLLAFFIGKSSSVGLTPKQTLLCRFNDREKRDLQNLKRTTPYPSIGSKKILNPLYLPSPLYADVMYLWSLNWWSVN